MEVINTRELASRLGRAPASVVRWRRLRKGPPCIRVNGRVFYDWEAVSDWLTRQSVAVALPTKAKPSRLPRECHVTQ